MKANQSGVRPFGQTTLLSSFASTSRHPEEDAQSKTSKQSVSLSEFLNRKIVKTTSRTIKVKQSTFASIGSGNKDMGRKRDHAAGGGLVLDQARFRRFNPPEKDECGMGTSGVSGVGGFESDSTGVNQDSRKRKDPCGVPSVLCDDERDSTPKYLVILGDDPKPQPKKREKRFINKGAKPFYNHYANGCGWWEGDKEGVDSEEVGCNEVWEGMGSTTLGGLQWH
ncbi:hypothetical protein COCNU_07G000920 [Cocos nucifera]|uniref:Uncharacterized protein n=1 Tax=Cocos nucifera TaxID=13894 RepID=A0A8K0IDM2_COCNU|nr:hypothetical protein COCNU_07G000920 [Cocos nucifera]